MLIGAARAGDPAMARSLVGSAKDAIEQKKYDTAISLLAKARAEDAELLDIAYWEAVAHEKKGDAAASLRAYRAFRDVASLAQARAALTKDQEGLLKKAQTRLTTLAPGEVEEGRLRAGLSTELFGLVKSKEAKDKAAAAIALEALLRAYPDHSDARQALARLTLPPLRKGEHPLPEALQGIATWNDMIAKTPFGDIPEWKYTDPGLVVEGSRTVGTAEPLLIKGDIALDLELRIVSTKSPHWFAGWSLVTRPELLSCSFGEGRATLGTSLEGSDTAQRIDERKLTDLVPGVWHRLSVLVNGKDVQMWVDGGKPFTTTWEKMGPGTQMALAWADCKFEMRTFRWARTR
jgi:hypothetical protein